MTKDETAKLAENIGNIAEDLLKQLTQEKIRPTYIEEFYLGLLQRTRIILKDAATILTNNHEKQICSAFILFRVLIDDFIRLFSVYASNNMEEDIIKIQADAHSHRFKNIEEDIKINEMFYAGQHEFLSTQKSLDDEKQKFLNNPLNDKMFIEKATFKLKKLPPISHVFNLMNSDVKIKANAHSYIVYKFLSQYVHYSSLTFDLDRDDSTRKLEINQIEEILFYTYKMILIQYDYFHLTYSLKLNDKTVAEFFNGDEYE